MRLACGPSAPQERTVRASGADRPQLTFQPKPEKQPLWYKTEISRRTVRAPWPDCPPFNFEAHTRETPFSGKKKYSSGPSAHLGQTVRQPTRASARSLERARTVRPSGADCPPAHQSHCKLSGTGADCPPLRRGLSAVTQSALKLSLFQIFSKRR